MQKFQLFIAGGIQAPDKAQITYPFFSDGSVIRGISKKEENQLNTFRKQCTEVNFEFVLENAQQRENI